MYSCHPRIRFWYSSFIHFLCYLYLHITFLWVLPQKQWFYCHPLHWQKTTVRLHIQVTLVNISCETKVSDLHDVVFSNKNVSGRQVSVNTLDKTDMFWTKENNSKKSETRKSIHVCIFYKKTNCILPWEYHVVWNGKIKYKLKGLL